MRLRGSVRIHAGEEGITSGSATLNGDIVHEDGAFIADAVDVGSLANDQAAMVDARLHPADVIPHDKKDVRFLRSSRLCVCGRTPTRDQSSDDCQTADQHPPCQEQKIRKTVHRRPITPSLLDAAWLPSGSSLSRRRSFLDRHDQKKLAQGGYLLHSGNAWTTAIGSAKRSLRIQEGC